MRVTLAAVGRMKAGPERTLVERYLQRFAKTGAPLGLDFRGVAEQGESRRATVDERMADEAARIDKALAEPCVRVVFDERGRSLSSTAFAQTLARFRDDGARDLAVCLGGPDGHDPAFRARADLVTGFGALTLPHQLARICLAEQLYRAATILAGHPYHRD